MKLVNYLGNEPNILHIPGSNFNYYKNIFKFLLTKKLSFADVENIDILICNTKNIDSPVIHQLEFNNIHYFNSAYYIEDILEHNRWKNIYKIISFNRFFNDNDINHKKYTLILDSRDVFINTFENILNEFYKHQRIWFSGTYQNYPNIYNFKGNRGDYAIMSSYPVFLNAGCILGPTESLKDMYNELCCAIITGKYKDFILDKNLLNKSEQYVIKVMYEYDNWQNFYVDESANIFATIKKDKHFKIIYD